MLTQTITQKFERAGVVAVVTIEDAADAVPVARALADGGISVVELTLRTAAATEAIRRIREAVPEILIGAGTILNADQVAQSIAAGAAFGVAPGCNPRTITAAREQGLPFAPGIMTPSDIEFAVEQGCRVLKYFPAETAGGLAGLRTMAAPFAHLGLRFVPLGGLTAAALPSYLASPMVLAVGGSWLVAVEAVKARNWEQIRTLAEETTRIVRASRPQ